MTDKEKIRAEIERLYNQSLADKNRQADLGLERAATASYGKSVVCKELLSFIDSIPGEPVSEELGEYINELSKQFPEVSFAKLSRVAVRVAKWQEKQVIDKTCKWIDENAVKYLVTDTIHGIKMTGLHASMTKDFKKYMED